MKTTLPLFNISRMASLTSSHIGDVGEHLVASLLGGYGYEVVHSRAAGHDIVAFYQDTAIRVNVKTTMKDSGGRNFMIAKGKSSGFRDYDGSNCDVFALLCLEDLSLSFARCEDYIGKRAIYIPSKQHKETDSYDSWERTILPIVSKKLCMDGSYSLGAGREVSRLASLIN